MRCYFVDGDGITVRSDISDSPWAMVYKNWQTGIPALALKCSTAKRPCDWLEIHCHGDPGILHLHPEVNFGNVTTFIANLKQLIQPHGRIEFLACLVARFDAGALAKQLAAMTGRQADVDLLNTWAADESKLTREFGRWVSGARSDEVVAGVPGASPMSLDHARVATLAVESGLLEIGSRANGPLFCSTVAKGTSCTVRAAARKQAEEYELAGQGSPFGRWDGHVFDFYPSGLVDYVGYNVPRPVYFPQDPTGEGATKIT